MSTDAHSNSNSIVRRIDACAECGGSLQYDGDHALRYCEQCGLVVDRSEDRLSREKDDGSLDGGQVVKDQDRPRNRHAARGEERTTFHAWDADDESKYDRLWNRHHGHYQDKDNSRQDRDKADILEALCDALHVPGAIEDHAAQLVAACNGRAFNRIGGLYAVILGAIAVAQNSTIETEKEYENRIQARFITDHDDDRVYSQDLPKFKHLAEKLDVDWRKAITRVKEQVDGR